MNTEKEQLKFPPKQEPIQIGVNISPENPDAFKASPPSGITLPFNVATDLNIFFFFFFVREFDKFRLFHCCDNFGPDYKIYGELPDGDKKLLFTSSHHFDCCDCYDDCHINFWCFGAIGFFLSYYFCDSILFQMDYRRNGAPFYTQGVNIKRGLHCCLCDCCLCCFRSCLPSVLFLRENTDPDDRDFDVGIKKGFTEVPNTSCCSCCRDKTAFAKSQEGIKGHTIRAKCCDICVQSCIYEFCCNCTCDFEMDIEDEKGVKVGNIMIYSGCYSEKVKDKCCFYPAPYYEINLPSNCTSEQKFQIIADTIHFDLVYRAI